MCHLETCSTQDEAISAARSYLTSSDSAIVVFFDPALVRLRRPGQEDFEQRITRIDG